MLALLPAFLLACSGASYKYNGTSMHEYFPLDGERTWEYAQEDEEILWQLGVEKVSQTETVGNAEVVTLEYTVVDPIELLYAIKWSSDASNGINIYGYSVEATGETVTYDPPIAMADYQMARDETVDTEVDGVVWRGTYVGVEDCPNYWVDTWECNKLTLLDDHGPDGDFNNDDEGEEAINPPFEGEWWLAPRYGPSRFIPSGYDTPWVLSRADWSSSEE